jgi:hypothetical protein
MNSTVYDWADLQNIRQPLIWGKIGYIPLQILFEELSFGGVAMPVTRVVSARKLGTVACQDVGASSALHLALHLACGKILGSM